MQHVYKCDHCSTTNIESYIILTHEIDCTFNPENKSCYTCKHHAYDYDLPYCKVKVDSHDDHLYDNIPCTQWELGED